MSLFYTFPQRVKSSSAVPSNIDKGRLPSWPAISIVILEVLGAVASPGLLTAMNAYLVLLALLVWGSSHEKMDRALLRATVPFIAIIAIGLVMGAGSDLYLYFKDVWYVANPAIVMSAGYVLYRCKPDMARGLRAFVIGGSLLGALHISRLAVNPAVVMLPAAMIRGKIGTGYYAPALALIILCAHTGRWKEKLDLSLSIALPCLLVCVASVWLSFSRTIIVVVLIGLLASIGAFSRREWLRFGLVALFGLMALSLLRWSSDTESTAAQISFFGKMARSLDEIRVEEYSDLKHINENWRGYETARALKHYESGSIPQWLFGYGFGAEVDLGLAMPLGGSAESKNIMRSIPIFHNGYIYLLIKAGLVGLCLYCYVAGWLYVVGRRHSSVKNGESLYAAARVLQAITLSLAIATWLVAGVFNKADMFPFLLAAGFLLAGLTWKQPQKSSSMTIDA